MFLTTALFNVQEKGSATMNWFFWFLIALVSLLVLGLLVQFLLRTIMLWNKALGAKLAKPYDAVILKMASYWGWHMGRRATGVAMCWLPAHVPSNGMVRSIDWKSLKLFRPQKRWEPFHGGNGSYWRM